MKSTDKLLFFIQTTVVYLGYLSCQSRGLLKQISEISSLATVHNQACHFPQE